VQRWVSSHSSLGVFRVGVEILDCAGFGVVEEGESALYEAAE